MMPMSIWSRIADALSALAAGEGLTVVFEKLRVAPDRSVMFTIAVIALGAKMAKADGHVTRDEVTDIAGFDDYARRIKAMYADNDETLCDLIV